MEEATVSSSADGGSNGHHEAPTPLRKHANRHVGRFLALPEIDLDEEENSNENNKKFKVQVVNNGKLLTAKRLLQNSSDFTLTQPILVQDTPESICMTVLTNKSGSNKNDNRPISVRDIANIVGHHYPVHVIDVEHQEELEGWTLADLVDYFEDEERLFKQHQLQTAPSLFNSNSNSGTATSNQRQRRQRKAAEKCVEVTASQQRPRVLNQISLEFSDTPLRDKIQSPQFVRDLDWIDHAWPKSATSTSTHPRTQYYCLTSASGCYTDFHLDFGGTSVWYHVMSGEKMFSLIPPTSQNLATYEDWLCRPNQAELFLPDMINNNETEVLRLSLKQSQTLVIPAGWIHAVYTPIDSVVVGGNFLHGLDISVQFAVNGLETRTRVQEKFRFPNFLPMHFYAGGMYLTKLRQGDVVPREVDGLGELINSLDEWWKVQGGQSKLQSGPTVARAAQESATKNNCRSVEEFIQELRKEHQRVLENGINPNPKFATKALSSPPPPPAAVSSPSKIKLKLKLGKRSSVGGSDNNASTAIPPPEVPSTTTTTSSSSGAGAGDAAGHANKKNNKFRIVLSSSAIKINPPTKNKRKVREDTEWVYDPTATADDEWMPEKDAKKQQQQQQQHQKKRVSITTTKSGGGTSGAAGNKGHPPKPHPQKQKTAPLSARQRLMKRFR